MSWRRIIFIIIFTARIFVARWSPALLVLWLAAAHAPHGCLAQDASDVAADSPVAEALERANAAIARIVAIPDDERTFDNTLRAIDDMYARLRLDTEMLRFMAYVSTDADQRRRGQRAEQDVQNWLIALSRREDLYRAVKAYADTNPQLQGEAARLLEHTMRDYRRAGMLLSPEKREQLTALEKQISQLGIEFEKNIREDETRVPLTRDELAGMDDEFLAKLERSGDLYLVGMDYPTFYPIMNFCENETTRQKVYVAYKRRAGRKNVEILERLLQLRAEAARLLGYESPAAYEIEIRMAKTPERVYEFYDKLRPLVRKKTLRDWQEFTEAKRQHTGNPNAVLRPWDQFFYKKRLLSTKYAVDSRRVQQYFPIERVIEGLFNITQSLYGLEYRDITAQASARGRPLWHPDVKLYEVWDKQKQEVIGEFYLDLYPRPNKYNHAAMWGLYPRKLWPDGSLQKPLAALVCNFTKPTADKPSLLTHDEVETFFHEFGHCLHGILTETTLSQFSGTAVARDFVEAPSQMFENWVWNADVLRTFARHYQTGDPFPDELLDGMLKARYLGSGLEAEHQFFYGLVDLAYHTAPDGKVDTTKVAQQWYRKVELYEPVPNTFFQASFGHLVGYQAGYYGYMWSLVYAQDMFQRFKELGMLSPSAGRYYRSKILARGGSMDEMEMLVDYLGRQPRMEPFLEHLGLPPNTNDSPAAAEASPP